MKPSPSQSAEHAAFMRAATAGIPESPFALVKRRPTMMSTADGKRCLRCGQDMVDTMYSRLSKRECGCGMRLEPSK